MINEYEYVTVKIGFVIRCLHAGIPVHWAIRSNKTKDGIDFTAPAARRVRPNRNTTLYDLPTGVVGGNYTFFAQWDSGGRGYNSVGTNVTFRGGPFIIASSYVSQALAVLDAMCAHSYLLVILRFVILFFLARTKEAE